MRPRHLAGALLIPAFFAFPLYLLSRSNGSPNGRSGGDFPGEGSCADSGCHDDGQPNRGRGTLSIAFDGAPAGQYAYTPGETVAVKVRLADPDAARIGFQLTARADAGCQPAGTFLSAETQVVVNPGPCGSHTVQWATHIFPKVGNAAEFAMNWTAPMRDIGPLTFAAAGNGANGVGRRGDNIYHTQAVIQPAADAGGPSPTPSISSGGVVLATLVPSVSTGAPNAIVSVFGTEFAPDGTAVLDPQLDDAGKIGTTLAGSCVEVSGRRSPLLSVTSTQVNFQVPDQAGIGPASVTVIRNCGATNERRSPVETFDIAAVQPAFFVFNSWGSQAIATLHGSGPSVVGPADLIPGVTTPAAPGEFISLYGTGFGATDPPLASGEIAQSVYPDDPRTPLPDTANVHVLFGGIEVPPSDIYYIGGAPCCAGLYQLTVKVPDGAADGNLPVELNINGAASPKGPFIAVQSAP